MIKLSIIIPVYNVEDYIASTIKSLFDQHNPAVEYIFVDDCGSDNSWHVLENTLKLYPESAKTSNLIRLPQNGGVENARICGLQQAKGEYIWFVDSDDLVAEGAINAILQTLAECPVDYLAIGFQQLSPGGVINAVNCKNAIRKTSSEELFWSIISYNDNHAAWKNIVKRELTLKYPMMRTGLKIAEDYVMHCCWSVFAESAAVLENPIYGYVMRPQSVMRKSKSNDVMSATTFSLQILDDFSKKLPVAKQSLFRRGLRVVRIKMRMRFFIDILNNHDKTEFKDLMQYQIAAEYSLLKDIWELPVELRPIMFCDRFKWYSLMRCYTFASRKLLQFFRKVFS